MKHARFIIRISLLILIGGIFLYFPLSHILVHTNTVVDKRNIVNCKDSKKTFIVAISEKGFRPEITTVYTCNTIIFANTGTVFHQPAFGDHPIHLLYPGFNEKALKPGQTNTVIMSAFGEYKIHDHIYDKLQGKIIVIN